MNRLKKQLSIAPIPGMEGQFITRNCFKNKKIAVLTSGGDSQGMNSAVRAVVRMGIYCGCTVYTVLEGYQGLVDGGVNIKEASWASVSGIMNKGGTVIGSARCMDFCERKGRLKGAFNLVSREITNLVVIGGDGSLTGANLFQQEWKSLLEELVKEKQISLTQANLHNNLNIVGLVGSIDNDFCGTDMTIGTDTALHRIIEACDAISSTAHSHQRCFVLEVMGRHCGYLALVASLASEAEWVFIPEQPPAPGWQQKLCSKLRNNRDLGQRVNIIIVAEGAIDENGNSISATSIRELITKEVKLDTRVTVLGHVQRGGYPSAFDRILGIRMGAEAVLALIDEDCGKYEEACVIAINGNNTVRVPLMKTVKKTQSVAEAMKEKDFEKAVKQRGKSFANNLSTYIQLSKSMPPKLVNKNGKRIGIINVGAPAAGMNAAMHSFTRLMISKGYDILGITEGFDGLVKGYCPFEDLTWTKVRGWVAAGGTYLGMRRDTPKSLGLDRVANALTKLNLSALLVIGGFEAYSSVLQLYKARVDYECFRIPMLVLPATISNNVPGSEFSLGADTSLNEITQIIDKVKQSAVGTKRRVFIVETQGAYCGYLATMSGLAGGADAAYIYEETFGIDDLRDDVRHMRAKIEDNVQRGLILVNENANKHYNTTFINNLFAEEGRGTFDVRINIPGHLQQGGDPSPFDRNMGIKLGYRASQWFEKFLNGNNNNELNSKETACLLGILCSEYRATPVAELEEQSDFEHRIPIDQWWLNLRSLLRIMARHESLYASEQVARRSQSVSKK